MSRLSSLSLGDLCFFMFCGFSLLPSFGYSFYTCGTTTFSQSEKLCQLSLFAAGRREWADVRRATGEKIFRPAWTGPRGHTPYSQDYITNDVKGRGKHQLPKDLLISVEIDGYEEIARIRHTGFKTAKPAARGFTAKCESIVSCSNTKLGNAFTQLVSNSIYVQAPLAH